MNDARKRVCGALAVGLALTTGAVKAQNVQTGFLDRAITIGGHEWRYQVYVPADYRADVAWPVILFLHGAGERGADGLLQTTAGLGNAIRQNAAQYPAIVVFPQAPLDSLWTGRVADMALAALTQTEREFSTDAERVYLTGMSMGGYGAWYLAWRNAGRFAAVAPVCAWVRPHPRYPAADSAVAEHDRDPYAALAARIGRLPVWLAHGALDPVVPVAESRAAFEAIERAGGDVRYTEFPDGNHNAWDPTYTAQEFSDWLFRQRRRR